MPETANRKHSRLIIMGAMVIGLVLLLAWAFWPRPTAVDIGTVTRGGIIDTIDEEARTRVRDTYVVSAPITGRLLRVEVEPGDEVTGGESIIARMEAAAPSVLDVRTQEQAEAAVRAAEAALRLARADLNAALAGEDLAEADLTRTRTLTEKDIASDAALDTAERNARAARASVDTAKAAISMREAELANARAQLINYHQGNTGSGQTQNLLADATIPLTAPISGRVLKVSQESETTLGAGTPILEIGDVSNDLEVIAELLSTDAVQVSAGDRVIIDNWGGDTPLEGVVERVEPWGFTKYSSLGVEEQRVNTIVRFSTPLERRTALGHGYRVETRIVVWEADDALLVPSAALFRDDGGWAVFRVADGKAEQLSVDLIRNNGTSAAVSGAVSAGDTLILYPGAGLEAGMRVVERKTGE